MVKIAPSILSADFRILGNEIAEVEKAGADLIHVDVMDGHFVPNITIGPFIVEAVKKSTSVPVDVHLMIENPEKYISSFADAGSDIIAVQIETCPHIHQTIQLIKERNVKPCVVLNPATPLATLDSVVLKEIDILMIMTVNPGFGGQTFIDSCLSKIREGKQLTDSEGYDIEIEVDGGVKVHNASNIIQAGADILVAGSAIFGSENYAETIKKLRNENRGA